MPFANATMGHVPGRVQPIPEARWWMALLDLVNCPLALSTLCSWLPDPCDMT